MMDFRKRAQECTNGSPILANRQKLTTEQVIALYPEGLTITDFDFLPGKDQNYVVCNFAEDPEKYFNGGRILTEIFAGFVEAYEGEYKKCREEFKTSGGIKVKLYYDRTKQGNRLVKVEVL